MSAPLCRDCEHRGLFNRCNSPENFKAPDLVTGHRERGYIACCIHRTGVANQPFDCGSEGRFFKPRRTLLARLLDWFPGGRK